MTSLGLVAIDIDGTLIDDKLRINEADAAAIHRLVDAGVAVVLASGRQYKASKPFARALDLAGPLIALQGGAVYDTRDDALLHFAPIPADVARHAFDWLLRLGYHVQLYFGDNLYLDKIDERARAYVDLTRVEPIVVPDARALLADAPPEPGPVKVLAIGTPEDVERDVPALQSELGAAARVFRSLPPYLEVTDAHTDKGHALRFVAAHLGVPLAATAAIGDSDNDVPMFQAVGVSFAVASGSAAAKSAASVVVAAQADGGVADAVSRLLAAGAHEEVPH